MGYAIAGELADRGACVTLVTGRTELPTPAGVERVDVLSATEMYDAAVRAFEGSDGAVMCAAVADYTPDRVSDTKIKKCDGDMCITLRRTRDIAAELERTRAAACWWDSPWKPTTNRRTPKPNSKRRISTSSFSTRCATPEPASAATRTR